MSFRCAYSPAHGRQFQFGRAGCGVSFQRSYYCRPDGYRSYSGASCGSNLYRAAGTMCALARMSYPVVPYFTQFFRYPGYCQPYGQPRSSSYQQPSISYDRSPLSGVSFPPTEQAAPPAPLTTESPSKSVPAPQAAPPPPTVPQPIVMLPPIEELIKALEGFRSNAYECSKNHWVYGYGSAYKLNWERVREGDTISQGDADKLLTQRIAEAEKTIDRLVKKNIRKKLTRNQRNALISWIYNFGSGNFAKSELLKKLNQNDFDGAAREILDGTKHSAPNGSAEDKTESEALKKRREFEHALFIGNKEKASALLTSI